MFARSLAFSLKPGSAANFTRKFETEVLPLLRAQSGFRDAIVLLNDDNVHVHSISMWDSREALEAYEKATYPGVLKAMESVLAPGTPRVRVSTVVYATTEQLVGVAA